MRAEEIAAMRAIAKRVPGYSDLRHYGFFKLLLEENPNLKSLLMLGVYHGRDICFLLDVLGRYHPGRRLDIVGVDKFSDDACADWPEDKQLMNWEGAGFGRAPTLAAAKEFIGNPDVVLIEAKDADYIEAAKNAGIRYDCIYLDTDHTEATVTRQIKSSPAILSAGAIICGDDYSDAGLWGVQTAVGNAFKQHNVFGGWIWNAKLEDLR